MVALIGLISAIIYGASDFFAGLASRRSSALTVVFFATAVALVLAAVAVAVSAPVWSVDAVVFGAIGGLLGAVGSWAFYASLAIGPMSILSPGVAGVSAIIPAIVGIALGERLSPIGYLALVIVLGAAALLSIPREGDSARVTGRAILLGLVAAVGYAGYVIAIHRTPSESGLVPLLADLAVATLVFGISMFVTRLRRGSSSGRGGTHRRPVDRRTVGLILVTGVSLAVANILLVIGLHLGELVVMSVINALYPLGTITLALIILRERLSWLQITGAALALAGSVILAVG